MAQRVSLTTHGAFASDTKFEDVRAAVDKSVQENGGERPKKSITVNLGKMFKVVFDVSGYDARDLTVTWADKKVSIEGKTDMKSFKKSFTAPTDSDMSQTTGALSSDGFVVFAVPREGLATVVTRSTVTSKTTTITIETKESFKKDTFFSSITSVYDKAIKNTMTKYQDTQSITDEQTLIQTLRRRNLKDDNRIEATEEDDDYHNNIRKIITESMSVHSLILLDVEGYTKDDLEITYKKENRSIQVEGSEVKKMSSKSFTKLYIVSENFKLEEAISGLSSDGILAIKVPKTEEYRKKTVSTTKKTTTTTTTTKESKIVSEETLDELMEEAADQNTTAAVDTTSQTVTNKITQNTTIYIEERICRIVIRVKGYSKKNIITKVTGENEVTVIGQTQVIINGKVVNKKFTKVYKVPAGLDLQNTTVEIIEDELVVIVPKKGTPPQPSQDPQPATPQQPLPHGQAEPQRQTPQQVPQLQQPQQPVPPQQQQPSQQQPPSQPQQPQPAQPQQQQPSQPHQQQPAQPQQEQPAQPQQQQQPAQPQQQQQPAPPQQPQPQQPAQFHPQQPTPKVETQPKTEERPQQMPLSQQPEQPVQLQQQPQTQTQPQQPLPSELLQPTGAPHSQLQQPTQPQTQQPVQGQEQKPIQSQTQHPGSNTTQETNKTVTTSKTVSQTTVEISQQEDNKESVPPHSQNPNQQQPMQNQPQFEKPNPSAAPQSEKVIQESDTHLTEVQDSENQKNTTQETNKNVTTSKTIMQKTVEINQEIEGGIDTSPQQTIQPKKSAPIPSPQQQINPQPLPAAPPKADTPGSQSLDQTISDTNTQQTKISTNEDQADSTSHTSQSVTSTKKTVITKSTVEYTEEGDTSDQVRSPQQLPSKESQPAIPPQPQGEAPMLQQGQPKGQPGQLMTSVDNQRSQTHDTQTSHSTVQEGETIIHTTKTVTTESTVTEEQGEVDENNSQLNAIQSQKIDAQRQIVQQAENPASQTTEEHENFETDSEHVTITKKTTRTVTKMSTNTDSVSLEPKGDFYQDTFFEDSRSIFENALKNTMNQFNDTKAIKDEKTLIKTLREKNYEKEKNPDGAGEDNKYKKIVVDVKGYRKESLNVSILDESYTIKITGKQEDRQGGSFSSKSFNKTYILNETYNLKEVTSGLSADGILTLKVPRLSLPGESSYLKQVKGFITSNIPKMFNLGGNHA